MSTQGSHPFPFSRILGRRRPKWTTIPVWKGSRVRGLHRDVGRAAGQSCDGVRARKRPLNTGKGTDRFTEEQVYFIFSGSSFSMRIFPVPGMAAQMVFRFSYAEASLHQGVSGGARTGPVTLARLTMNRSCWERCLTACLVCACGWTSTASLMSHELGCLRRSKHMLQA